MRPPGLPDRWDQMSAMEKARTIGFYQTQFHMEDEWKTTLLKAIAGRPRL